MYFRGASSKETLIDKQLEDNLTKALINLLEYSDKEVLKKLLGKFGIFTSTDNIGFDIQVAIEESRPDALIRTNINDIYIESKFDSPFNRDQLDKYVKYVEKTKGYILYISKEKYTREIIQTYIDNQVIFINWIDITEFLIKQLETNTYKKESITYFLVKQYLGYMEELNVIPFMGWKNRDFEAFLSLDNENLKVSVDERKRVKDKLKQFITELKEIIEKKSDYYKNCIFHLGNLDKEHVWSALKLTDKNLIDQVHISIIVYALNLSIGIQLEGIKPTTKAIRKIKNDQKKFKEILKDLSGFIFIIRERFHIQASIWDSKVVAQLVIDSNTTDDDVVYIIKKIDHYDKVELRIVKVYDKQDAINKEEKFIDESIDTVLKLQEMIKFLQ